MGRGEIRIEAARRLRRLLVLLAASLAGFLLHSPAFAGGAEPDEAADQLILTAPEPGKRVTLLPEPGQALVLDLASDRSEPQMRLLGRDLVIWFPGARLEDDSMIVVEGYADMSPPPDLETRYYSWPGSLLLQLALDTPPGGLIDPLGMAPDAAAGGSPVASLPVFGWFVSRLQGFMAASAAESPQLAESDEQAARLAVLLSGLDVIRARDLKKASDRLVTEIEALAELIDQLVNAGRGGKHDVTLVVGWRSVVRYEQIQAEAGTAMALDNYEVLTSTRPALDAFEATAGRDDALAEEVDAFLDKVPEDKQTDARQVWRRWSLARTGIRFRREHLTSLEALRDAYRAQFDIGLRSVQDLLSIERALFDARADLIDTQHILSANRGRALAAIGDLRDSDLTRVEAN